LILAWNLGAIRRFFSVESFYWTPFHLGLKEWMEWMWTKIDQDRSMDDFGRDLARCKSSASYHSLNKDKLSPPLIWSWQYGRDIITDTFLQRIDVMLIIDTLQSKIKDLVFSIMINCLWFNYKEFITMEFFHN